MKRLFSILWFSMRGIYEDLFVLLGIGGLWLVMAVLLPSGMFWLTSTLMLPTAIAIVLNIASLVLVPPATAAVYHVTSHIARKKRVEFGYFWQGFKAYFWHSWKVAGVLIVIGAILAVDVLFYLNNSGNTLFLVVGLIGLWILAFWLGIQVYLFPLMVVQEDKSLKLLLKNASLLTLSYPFFAFTICIVLLLVTALSILLPVLFLLWMPFVSLLNNRALTSSLEQVEAFQKTRRELEEEKKEG
jgi:uncharacterized membrane protein YesL